MSQESRTLCRGCFSGDFPRVCPAGDSLPRVLRLGPLRPCPFGRDGETGEGIADAPSSFPAMLFWGGMARTALIGYLEMGILGGFGLEITVFLEYGVIRGELLQREPSNGL